MSTHIEPTIGRIVYFRGHDGATRPAIVVGVNGTFNLDLYVFGQDSDDNSSGHMGHVTHADPEQEPNCFPSWHWMPYQKQQAEKQAVVEQQAFSTALPAAPTRDLTFGSALNALKGGHRVARAGWNGKGMFAYLVPANSYPAQTGAAKAHFGEGGLVPYNAYLALKGADNTVSTWAPSGSDALAEDWLIVE